MVMERAAIPRQVSIQEFLKVLEGSDGALIIAFKEDRSRRGINLGPIAFAAPRGLNSMSVAALDELVENLVRYLKFYAERRKGGEKRGEKG